VSPSSPKHLPTVGERARRFTLELPVDTPDGFGGTLRTYQAGPQLWGAMEMLSGAERIRGGRPESVVTHRAILPFRPGVTDAMRLALGLRRFRIRACSDPDGGGRHLVCLLEEMPV
jgi:SPP1 family predicted phage head-tail adaptor